MMKMVLILTKLLHTSLLSIGLSETFLSNSKIKKVNPSMKKNIYREPLLLNLVSLMMLNKKIESEDFLLHASRTETVSLW
jgi:hypothetical protein